MNPKLTTNLTAACILISLLCILTFAAYANTFHVPFTFDDRPFILKDTHVHLDELTMQGLVESAVKGRPRHRPFSNVSFAINYWFCSNDPFGYHVVNLIIHASAGIFLFLLIMQTIVLVRPVREEPDLSAVRRERPFSPAIVSFLGVSLWVVHPLHTESVTYICQRMTSLAGMLYILSLFLYVVGRVEIQKDSKRLMTLILCFSGCLIAGGLSIASKPNAATLPIFILMYEWFFFQALSLRWMKKYWLYLVSVIFVFPCPDHELSRGQPMG